MIVLTAQELRELTGKKRTSAICRVLGAMGIPFRPRPKPDVPAVLWIHVRALPGAEPEATMKRRPQVR